jgi:protein YIPF5/7
VAFLFAVHSWCCAACRGWFGLFLAGAAILLATHAASRIVAKACSMQDQFFLVAYPILLLYGCFALITVF